MDNSAGRLIDWAIASRTMEGQSESGDRAWVKVGAKSVLLAVVDGSGHGPEAARAAQAVVSTLEEFSHELPVDLLKRCHEASRVTRGAVMSLASFDRAGNTMTWVGLGNVEGILFHRQGKSARGRERLIQTPGVLGNGRVHFKPSVHKVSSGDLLIFAADGVRPDFSEEAGLQDSTRKIADRILDRCAHGNDDALVLVARYGHGQGETKIR